jgi:hypothetical protein
MEIEGARMEVEMESKKIRLINNVKTKMEPQKLAQRNKANKSARVGG